MTTEEVKVAEFELPEGFNPNVCDVCGGLSGGEHVGVAAIPGVPMSISWCRECLNHSATPEWNVRTEFAFVGGEFASWFLEQELWAYSEGRYRSVREWPSSSPRCRCEWANWKARNAQGGSCSMTTEAESFPH